MFAIFILYYFGAAMNRWEKAVLTATKKETQV